MINTNILGIDTSVLFFLLCHPDINILFFLKITVICYFFFELRRDALLFFEVRRDSGSSSLGVDSLL